MDETIRCQAWCGAEHDPADSDCENYFFLFDADDYKAEEVAVPGTVVSPEMAAMRELFANSAGMPPESDNVCLFALHDLESDSVDVAVQLWQTPPRFDQPIAVASMNLQGLKDQHQKLGAAIKSLEG